LGKKTPIFLLYFSAKIFFKIISSVPGHPVGDFSPKCSKDNFDPTYGQNKKNRLREIKVDCEIFSHGISRKGATT
jgi:hypothetical protein